MNAKVIVVLLLLVAVADHSMAKKCKARALCPKVEALESQLSDVSSEYEAKNGDLQNQIDELSERVRNLENATQPTNPPQPPQPPQVTCTSPFLKFQSSCYLFAPSRGIWEAAIAFCRSDDRDARLVSIKTQEEQNFVARHLRGNSWLGMTDLGQEGTWVWGADRSRATYTNWNVGEPNGGTGENIGSIYRNNGKWNDVTRHQQLSYVCKKPGV